MGFVNTLIQNDWYSQAGLLSDHADAMLGSDEPPDTLRWRLWLHAESARQHGELRRCARWLTAAERVPGAADVLWRAEFGTTLGKALQADGEPGRAFQALVCAYDDWRRISALMGDIETEAGASAGVALYEAVRQMVGTLIGDQVSRIRPSLTESFTTWFADRLVSETFVTGRLLIQLSGEVGSAELGQRIAADLLAWLPQVMSRRGLALASSDVHLDLGNVAQVLGDSEAAARHAEQALALLRPYAGLPMTAERITTLTFNRANALVHLQAYEEAIAAYERTIEEFHSRGQREPELRARYARLFALWKRDPSAPLMDSVRQLIAEYEALARSNGAQDPERRPARESLETLYRMLLTLLAQGAHLDERTLDEMLKLVAALRDERLLVGLTELTDAAPERVPQLDVPPLALLDRRLARLPSTALLIWEAGVDRIVLLLLVSGPAPLVQRVVVATGGADLVAASGELLCAARDASDRLSARVTGAASLSDVEIRRAGEQVAAALPAPIRAALAGVTTLLFSPSAFGFNDELPIELMRDGDTYFGVTHVVARFPSITLLLETLAPNRVNRPPSQGGVVVRAGDRPGLDPLSAAEEDAAQVVRAMQLLGMPPDPPEPLVAPTPTRLLELLDAGRRMVHYVGHGMASESGEELFLGEASELSASDLAGLRGTRTPFVYLSACLVGRARHLQGGRQKGFGVALLEAGAPAVVAANYAVPDHICADLARKFYGGAWQEPVGEALRQARERILSAGLHPVCAASFVLQGDPLASISQTVPDGGSARYTLDWPAYLIRFITTDDEPYRAACLSALASERARAPQHAALLDSVAGWVRGLNQTEASSAVRDAARERLIADLVLFDIEGAAALRLLLSRERVDAIIAAPGRGNRGDDLRREIGGSLALALALSDSYAFVLFASYHVDLVVQLTESVAVLQHAERCLDAIAADSSRVGTAV